MRQNKRYAKNGSTSEENFKVIKKLTKKKKQFSAHMNALANDASGQFYNNKR